MAKYEQFQLEGSDYIHLEVSPSEFAQMLQDPHSFIAREAPEAARFMTRGRAVNFNVKSFSTTEDTVTATETTSPCVQALKINGVGNMCVCTPIVELEESNTFTVYAARD